MESECKKCKKKKCNTCRGPRGFVGPVGPKGDEGVTGPTGPAGIGEPRNGAMFIRKVIYNPESENPQLIINASGPGDFDGQLGIAIGEPSQSIVIFFYVNSAWVIYIA